MSISTTTDGFDGVIEIFDKYIDLNPQKSYLENSLDDKSLDCIALLTEKLSNK